MTKTTKVATAAALLAVLVTAPASARDWYGVDMDAVPWATFCPAVESVPVERGGRLCGDGHPASEYHGTFRDFTGRGDNPPANCDIVANEWQWWTTPRLRAADPWHMCASAWGRALKDRATEPERFREPFGAWRARYFGAWLTGGSE